MERCANCERQIGNLETPYLWQERVVCAECHSRLSPAKVMPPLRSIAQARAEAEAKVPPLSEYIARDRRDKSGAMAMTMFRIVLFVLAIATSFSSQTIVVAAVLWLAWIIVGVGGIIVRSNNR